MRPCTSQGLISDVQVKSWCPQSLGAAPSSPFLKAEMIFQGKSFTPGGGCGGVRQGTQTMAGFTPPEMCSLGHRCRQSSVLYLLHLHLLTVYTLQATAGLFLGHFRNIYFCKSYFWERCQTGNCSHLYIPHKDIWKTATASLFLTAPQRGDISLQEKGVQKKCPIVQRRWRTGPEERRGGVCVQRQGKGTILQGAEGFVQPRGSLRAFKHILLSVERDRKSLGLWGATCLTSGPCHDC